MKIMGTKRSQERLNLVVDMLENNYEDLAIEQRWLYSKIRCDVVDAFWQGYNIRKDEEK